MYINRSILKPFFEIEINPFSSNQVSLFGIGFSFIAYYIKDFSLYLTSFLLVLSLFLFKPPKLEHEYLFFHLSLLIRNVLISMIYSNRNILWANLLILNFHYLVYHNERKLIFPRYYSYYELTVLHSVLIHFNLNYGVLYYFIYGGTLIYVIFRKNIYSLFLTGFDKISISYETIKVLTVYLTLFYSDNYYPLILISLSLLSNKSLGIYLMLYSILSQFDPIFDLYCIYYFYNLYLEKILVKNYDLFRKNQNIYVEDAYNIFFLSNIMKELKDLDSNYHYRLMVGFRDSSNIMLGPVELLNKPTRLNKEFIRKHRIDKVIVSQYEIRYKVVNEMGLLTIMFPQKQKLKDSE